MSNTDKTETPSPDRHLVPRGSAALLGDPLLLEIAALPAIRMSEWLECLIRDIPATLLNHAMLIQLLKQTDNSGFCFADVTISVVSISRGKDQIHAQFDFLFKGSLQSNPAEKRKIDGEGVVVFLPKHQMIFDLNFAEINKDDDEAVVASQSRAPA